MLDSWTFLDSPVVFSAIVVISTTFLLFFLFIQTTKCWAKKRTSSNVSSESENKRRIRTAANDEEFVKAMSSLVKIERLGKNQQTLVLAKNKKRSMLRLRKRVTVLFPKMGKKETEQFCVQLYDLAKNVAQKKNV